MVKIFGRFSFTSVSFVLILACSLVGCSDDGPSGPGDTDGSYGTGLIGSWVEYDGLLNGSHDQYGGSFGAGGEVMVVRTDGTGEMSHVEDPAEVMAFDWTAASGVITVVSDEFGGQTANYLQSGDQLTILSVSEEGTYSFLYHRHLGSAALLGGWILQSSGGKQAADKDGLLIALDFKTNGTVEYFESMGGEGTVPYSTDGPWMEMGSNPEPDDLYVFAVIGNTLYLFGHNGISMVFEKG